MRIRKRRFGLLLVLALALVLMQNPSEVLAAGKYHYSYRIVIYTGNQGTIQSVNGISVEKASGGSKEAVIEQIGDTEIRVSGLEYGDRVTIHPQNGMVNEVNPEKYYIRGLRESGKDNNTVGSSSFRVDKDIEYVVAYGIRGDMVQYTVNYLDEEGNPLRESETFYGVEGDKPVIAYQYIDGYQPQAYNLTKTLQRNEAENVFTFVYRPVVQAENPAETTAANPDGGAAPGGNTTDGNTPGGNTTDGNTPGGNTTDGNTPGGNTTDGNTPGGNDETQNAGETTVAATEETEPQELIDIDDETVPLADGGNQQGGNQQKSITAMIPVVVGAAAVILLLIWLLLLLAKKKGQKEDHG